MATIAGTIRIGEATKASARISKRQLGGTLWQYVILVLFIGAGALGGNVSEHWFHHDGALPNWFIGAGVGGAFSIFALRSLVVWQLRKKLTKAGTPLDMPLQFKISANGLHYCVADIEKRAPWKVVSEVFHAKGYWIFLAQSEPWFAPDRLFANKEERCAFIAEALSYMSDAARARSKEAVKFAGGKP